VGVEPKPSVPYGDAGAPGASVNVGSPACTKRNLHGDVEITARSGPASTDSVEARAGTAKTAHKMQDNKS
jgi:hypothetical protein